MVGDSTPVIVGPTAVGKTAVAVALAAYLPLEVISADSRQVYRGLDVGTAKPTRRERAAVPHHGLDLVRPGERYGAGRFARDAERWLAEIRARDRLPIVVGGTGLYVRALAEGLFAEPSLDPERRRALERWTTGLPPGELVRWASRLDPAYAGGGRQRAARAVEIALLTGRPLSAWQAAARHDATLSPWYVRLTVPRPVLHQRILHRARQMVQQGLIEEVAAALADGAPPGTAGLDGVGVREAAHYLLHGGDRAEVADAIAISTRQYAKRQETWFRHQLPGEVLVLDATRPAHELAAEIAARWAARQHGSGQPA
ncbi:MAG: tRNA (adenosine(37)-N6)-dimethylallyltransferase MiaA [Gemmatimonadales bacterium]|nr:tRNA (adenosine(37)-N6)-dimethylallyltransferase MiaA [Gemmatimonadales bacterium]